MTRGFLIRRWPDIAFATLLAAGLWSGGAAALSDLPRVLSALPGMAAQASPEHTHGFARLAVDGFAPSRFAPQLLYPLAGGVVPEWLREGVRAGQAGPAPVLRGVTIRPVIAICIDDLGEDLAGTDKAMALPGAIALAFLPYAETTPFLAAAAARRGHLVLAHVPMQALGARDPGPMALKPGMAADEITRRLDWNLARVPQAAGINNHEGSAFTADAAALTPVMARLKARGLFFLDSRTSAASAGEAVARTSGIETAGRDIFLDDDQSEATVQAQLDALVATAKRNGAAIAIGHPHAVTLKLLNDWLKQDHGVTLVPLDQAMRLKAERATAIAAR